MANALDDLVQSIKNIAAQAPGLDAFIAKLKTLGISADDVSKVFKIFPDVFKKFGDAGKVSKQVVDALTTAAKEAITSFSDFGKTIEHFQNQIQRAGSNKALMENILNTASNVVLLTTKFYDFTGKLGEFANRAGSSADSINNISQQLQGVISKLPGLGSLGGFIGQAIVNFNQAANAGKGFETSLLEAAMAGGSFYDATSDALSGFSDKVTDATTKIGLRAENSAMVLGVSFTDALKRQQEVLRALPGEYEKTFDLFDSFADNAQKTTYSTTDLLSRVARGTGLAFTDALGIASEAFGRFGKSSQEQAERISILNKTAQTLKIPFGDIKGLVSEMDNKFHMWNTQISGTVGILGNMTNAMKESGVGFRGQIELVKTLEGGINSMTLPMRAFIGLSAGMTGTGGAIGAGLKMEQMLQAGKMGDIVDMVQETLEKKTGAGRVLTLGEAAEAPEQQRAFLVQRQLLSQMTGTTDTGTLNRLMEAMSKTRLGGGAAVDAQTALKEAMSAGREMTESQTDIVMQQLAVQKDMAAYMKGMHAAMIQRTITGMTKEDSDKIRIYNEALLNKQSGITERTFKSPEIAEQNAKTTAKALSTVVEAPGRVLSGFAETPMAKDLAEMATPGKGAETLEKLKTASVGGTAGKILTNIKRFEEGEKLIDLTKKEITLVPRGMETPVGGFAIPKGEPFSAPIKFEPLDVNITIMDQEGNIYASLVKELEGAFSTVKRASAT